MVVAINPKFQPNTPDRGGLNLRQSEQSQGDEAMGIGMCIPMNMGTSPSSIGTQVSLDLHSYKTKQELQSRYAPVIIEYL